MSWHADSNSTPAQLAGAVRSSTVILLGDSFLAGGSADWGSVLIPATKGRLRVLRYTGGVGGNSSAAMLARLATDVIRYAPAYCLVGAVTPNDPGQGLSVDASKVNIQSIVARLMAANITPLLVLGPPNDTAATRNHIATVNGWLRYWGSANGYRVLDPWAQLTDPADGTWLAGYTSDGTHPTGIAAKLAGIAAAAQLEALPAVPLLSAGAGDPTNLVPNPCFDPHAGGLATSWGKSGTAVASITAVSSAIGAGNWQELTAGDATLSVLSNAVATIVGNVYEVAFGVKCDATGRPFTRFLTSPAFDPFGDGYNRGEITEADGLIVTGRFTAVGTSTPVYLGTNGAAGVVGYRQVTVRDLTALGVA